MGAKQHTAVDGVSYICIAFVPLLCCLSKQGMCQPPSTACNTISYSYKPTSKNPNYPFKGDAAVCKIILAHTPSQFLKSEEMPTEPCQATVSKTKIVGRLSKASDHPSLLLLIKRGVKINILCGLQKQSLKSTCSG